jgi:choline dehydrogenase-like flavoprotein
MPVTNFAERIKTNQEGLLGNLKSFYDFIVCGSGSSGSVVARRLAEIPDATVLLIEAGGSDDVPAVEDAARWPENLGSERDWAFPTRANPHLNGRALVCSMGKVEGGSSSINLMVWSRGHRNDWDGFAEAAGDPAWNYDSVLGMYRQIEDWQGSPDTTRRGSGGEVFVQPAPNPNPIATAMVEAASSIGIPAFADQNGAMMEADRGAALSNLRIRDGKRLSVFRSYVYPWMDRPNLTVLTETLVTKVLFDGKRATGVEVVRDGKVERFQAGSEVVLSLGAIQTPKVLMQSGVGDTEQLQGVGIGIVQHLPGVGANLQEHVLFGGCVWEYARPDQFQGSGAEATFFAKSDPALATPDLQAFIIDGPFLSSELSGHAPTSPAWSITPGLVRPRSRGQVRLTGAKPTDPVDIDANIFSQWVDVRAAMECVRLCREVGNAPAFCSLTKRESYPGPIGNAELEAFVRSAAVPFWHYTCSAKMGRDDMAVVDGNLRVYGIDGLRIADGSIMPNITTGNTMAPCVIIGERAAQIIRKAHAL